MFNDDESCSADEDLFFCTDCHEYAAAGADHCDSCHEGRCGICGELIAKGAPHGTDPQGAVYCKPCDDLAAQESVVEIAEKLGAASDGVPVLLADDEAEETTPLPYYEPMAAVVNGRLR